VGSSRDSDSTSERTGPSLRDGARSSERGTAKLTSALSHCPSKPIAGGRGGPTETIGRSIDRSIDGLGGHPTAHTRAFEQSGRPPVTAANQLTNSREVIAAAAPGLLGGFFVRFHRGSNTRIDLFHLVLSVHIPIALELGVQHLSSDDLHFECPRGLRSGRSRHHDSVPKLLLDGPGHLFELGEVASAAAVGDVDLDFVVARSRACPTAAIASDHWQPAHSSLV